MAEPGPVDRKTDYFSTFLDRLSRGVEQQTVRMPGLAAPADLKDSIIRMLKSMGGESSISQLLVPSITSITPIIAVLQELQSFGLVEQHGGRVRLTEDGDAVAETLGPQSATGPGNPVV